MQYSLGNMLKGGGALNPDGLALDLAFALDKTLTARKGPTPAFTRVQATSTGSTYIGADKLINYAAANEPRFDHDPVTGLCKGLLIEESRTNLLERSEEFDNVYWTKSGLLAPVPDSGTSPSGAITADLLIEDTGPAQHRASRSLTVVSGTTYTASVFVKRGAGSRQFSIIISSPTVVARVYFNIDNETVATTVAGSGTIKAFPNGWYLCTATGTVASTSATVFLQMTNGTASGNETYTGDGTSGLYLWGAQLEEGAFPLSYIPTTIGTAIRSADVCSVTTADWSNAGNDTMLVQYFIRQHVANAMILEGSSPSNSWLSVSCSGLLNEKFRGRYTHGDESTRSDITSSSANSLIAVNKGAVTSGVQICLNGSLTQVVATQPNQVNIGTSLSIGSRGNGSSLFLNGHIARIQYFRKRLSNAKLQTLTTP